MKYIWVLIDKETGEFWGGERNYRKSRAIRAYKSEAKAWAAVATSLPKVYPSTVIVKKFREITQ